MSTRARACRFFLGLLIAARGFAADQGSVESLAKGDQDDARAADASKGSESARMEEMYQKMRHAVEEIAELYGSPVFVQIFTNDKALADELRLRLSTTEAIGRLKAEANGLNERCESLRSEISKRQAEVDALNKRLLRQRAALAALGAAIDGANRAVEATTP